MDKETKIQLVIILILAVILAILMTATFKEIKNNQVPSFDRTMVEGRFRDIKEDRMDEMNTTNDDSSENVSANETEV